MTGGRGPTVSSEAACSANPGDGAVCCGGCAVATRRGPPMIATVLALIITRCVAVPCISCSGGGDLTSRSRNSRTAPGWPATWNLSRSTMTFPDGNHSGFANAERTALDARYGLVVYGWELRVCLTAVVSSPRTDCSNSAAEWSMDEQARRVKAINPLTRVFYYRNTMLALSPFKDQCRKMYSSSGCAFFLRQGDRDTGPPLNRAADPRSIEPCQPNVLPRGCHLPWGCRAIEQDQYLTDFQNASAADWFVDTVIGRVVNSSSADGVWFDDVGGAKVDDARAAIARGFPPARLAALGAAANATVLRAEQLLKAHGKWSFNTPGGFVTLPSVTNVTSQCVSALLQGAALAAKWPSVMYVDYFEPPTAPPGLPPPATTAHDFQQRLAAFLLVRGNFSYFGHGWITTKPPVWYPEWDLDVGTPLGPMQQNGSTFVRRWTMGTVSLDCNSFTAELAFRPAAAPLKTDDGGGTDRRRRLASARLANLLACQPPHDSFPFCDTTLAVSDRIRDLISRIDDADKPSLLTARSKNSSLPALGVPGAFTGDPPEVTEIPQWSGRCSDDILTQATTGAPIASTASVTWPPAFAIATT